LFCRLPGSSLSFSAAQDDLAREGIASLALDLPGFGLSDKPSDVSYTLDFLAQATVEALTSLHVDKVHLVAFGESCFVAARIGERFGHVISSLALIDCEVPPTRSPPLPLFAFEHSPALPLFAYSLLFGGPLKDESTAVAAANRWLTVYKGGQTAYFSFCTASGERKKQKRKANLMC
jgi:pimeloyl-ACP methyl ester carboxylesterase